MGAAGRETSERSLEGRSCHSVGVRVRACARQSMLRLEKEVDEALVALERAKPPSSDFERQRALLASDAPTAPFKFLLQNNGGISEPWLHIYTPRCSTMKHALSNFWAALELWDACDLWSLHRLMSNRERAVAAASLFSRRQPFCRMQSSKVTDDAALHLGFARAIFGIVATEARTRDDETLRELARTVMVFWNKATASKHVKTENLFMHPDTPPLECRWHIDDGTALSNTRLASPPPSLETSPLERARLFAMRLRTTMDASVASLSALLVPCDTCPIPTPAYFDYLEMVYSASVRIARLQGVAGGDEDAFMLAALCCTNVLDPRSFDAMALSCARSLSLEPPHGAVSFVWITVFACFHCTPSEPAADGSLARAVVAQLETMQTREGVAGSLARLAVLIVSSRSRIAFRMLLSEDATMQAARGETRVLDVLSHSPSGLLGIYTEDGVAATLLGAVTTALCASDPNSEAHASRLQSVRTFVSLEEALVADDGLERMIGAANVQLEKVLLAMRGPCAFLPAQATLEEHAARAKALRRKAICAVRTGYRCRVAVGHNELPLLVAWLSDGASNAVQTSLALFARHFATCDSVVDSTASFDFEDDLRRALRRRGADAGFLGAVGKMGRENLRFPHLDERTTHAVRGYYHGFPCSRVHTPIAGFAAVSVMVLGTGA